MEPVTITIIGCGRRGLIYSSYSKLHPDECKVVGVCDPIEEKRNHFASLYDLKENVFTDWREIVKLPNRISKAVIICTQDKQHSEPAIAFANLGYDILLEKPMATTEEECIAIEEAATRNKIIFAVGHVLRYMPYSIMLKKLLDDGVIGEIINIQHLEPVGFYHYAHSYVRGNWHNSQESSFSLLAKSCHDIDWLLWMIGKKCIKISSFGSLKHFTPENKPANATERCLDCPVSKACVYSAETLYLDPIKKGIIDFPTTHINIIDPTVENVTEALRTGDYGRCVYSMDNDVMDNQVVNMQFEGGATASFSMIAFTKEQCIRKTRIFGTTGDIEGDGENVVKVYNALTRETTIHDLSNGETNKNLNMIASGHGGGDFGLMGAFIKGVMHQDQSYTCNAKLTLASHLMVFHAENARLQNKVIDLSW